LWRQFGNLFQNESAYKLTMLQKLTVKTETNVSTEEKESDPAEILNGNGPLNCEGYLTKYKAMKTFGGGGIVPCILNLGTRRR
jgi:hypothetical protein